MNPQFHQAFAFYLSGHAYREAMIDCGVHALQNGRGGYHSASLAAGDADDAETLLENFRSAALECGVPLPPIEDAETWLVEYVNLRTDIDHAFVSVTQEFDLSLRYLFGVLSRSESRSVDNFLDHFGKFLDITGSIDEYQSWLDQLQRLSREVQRSHAVSLEKRITGTIEKVIMAVSYSVPTEQEITECRTLIRELIQHRDTKQST